MGPLISIIIFIAVVAIIFKIFSTQEKEVNLQEEREALKYDLEEMVDELENLNNVIEQPGEIEVEEDKLRRLKTQVASHRVDLKHTIDKVKIEGKRNWAYRKTQAKRSLKKTRNFTSNELVQELN